MEQSVIYLISDEDSLALDVALALKIIDIELRHFHWGEVGAVIAACESCAPEIMLVDLGEEELSVGLGKEGVDVVPLNELQAGLSHWLPIVGLGGRDVLAWVKERDESSLIGTVALPIQNPAFSQLVLRIISEKAICE